jgi:hypothetical protein
VIGIAEQIPDPLIAVLVGDLGIPLLRRGMGTGAEDARPGGEHGRAQRAEGRGDLTGGGQHVGDQLDLAGVQLSVHAAVHLSHRGHHTVGAVDQPTGQGIDEEQLLLDSDGERRAGAELMVEIRHR